MQKGMSEHQTDVSEELHKLENSITNQRKEIISEIGEKLDYTNHKMETVLLENNS